MQNILVIGASGFVGGEVARGLLADGHTVRCMLRQPSRAVNLAGCEIVQGDMADLASVQRAMEGTEAVYISIHTLSPQPANTADHSFMDLEMVGLANIVAAGKAHGVRRLIYVTSLGIAPDAASVWLRERYNTEQFLIDSGIDATVIRPGMIVGANGRGFGMMVGRAKSAVGINIFGAGRQKMRDIAIDDLVYYLVGVLDDPRAHGQRYDVGNDEVLTVNRMTDIVADVLGRRHPLKLDAPMGLLRPLAPMIERRANMPKGALTGVLGGLGAEGLGDPLPIRALLPRPLLSFREAVERALNSGA